MKKLTKEVVLSKIDPKYHDVAEAMVSKGIDWTTIFTLLTKFLPLILALFNKTEPAAQVGQITHHKVHCPEELKGKLVATRVAVGEAFCAAICAEHCAGCDEDPC